MYNPPQEPIYHVYEPTWQAGSDTIKWSLRGRILLLVMLDYVRISYRSFIRIESCMPPGTPLA
jgi:hypothetical protein